MTRDEAWECAIGMTDADLAAYLGLTPAQAAIVLPQLTPGLRATYEAMHRFEADLAHRDKSAPARALR